MRSLQFYIPLMTVSLWFPSLLLSARAQADEAQPIALTTHNQASQPKPPAKSDAIARIRKIILNQGEDARALANLVQLSRDLPAESRATLYNELADDYLRRGKYNQSASVLQQLLNQHTDQPRAHAALAKLLRLFSSSEIILTQNTEGSSAGREQRQQEYLKYASFVATATLQKDHSLVNDPAIAFQRATIARLAGQERAADGRFNHLKRSRDAGVWQTRALAENWLKSDREEASPLPTLTCPVAQQKPHLDGQLGDSIWNGQQPLRMSYDQEFLYVAISYQKEAGHAYALNSEPRTHDTNLAGHDRVQLRIDTDRDYATYFELNVDHAGRTSDRCWLDASWNLNWFVAAAEDGTTWTIEGAIPWDQITQRPPLAGEAWAIAARRILPSESSADRDSASEDYQLLLFQ